MMLNLEARATEFYTQLPDGIAGQLGTVLLGVGSALAANHVWKMWPVWKQRRADKAFAVSEAIRKAMRTREAMDNREVRLREMLSEMLTDGILDRQANGVLSDQEGKRLMFQLSLKLNLPDIVPPKTRVDIVKQQIRARFHLNYYRRGAKEIEEIIQRKLTPPTLPVEAEVVAKPANKYWRPKPVAA